MVDILCSSDDIWKGQFIHCQMRRRFCIADLSQEPPLIRTIHLHFDWEHSEHERPYGAGLPDDTDVPVSLFIFGILRAF